MARSSLSLLATAAVLAGCASTPTVQDPAPGPSASTKAGAPTSAMPTAAARADQGAAARPNPSASVHVLGVPPGHLPRAGLCRVWVPGMPPGRQQKARTCRGIMETATAGSWVLYRPTNDPSVIHVHYVDNVRSDAVVAVRYFNANSGAFLREEAPGGHRDDENEFEDPGRGQGREHGHQRP